jgi:hypothetical protein
VSDSKPTDDADASDDVAGPLDRPGDARELQTDNDDAPEGGDEDEDEDEKIDLDDLDALGVDGVVEQMGGAGGSGTARRPAWVSVVVLVASVGLLAWLWPDFRFWMQPDEPIDIGHVSQWMEGGKVPAGWTNAHVALDGTPNVKWAMLRGDKDGERKSFFDVVEAEGQLFVSTPQLSDDHETRRYPGHFEGRLLRLGDDQLAMTRMAQLYSQENVTRAVDIAPSELADVRRDDGLRFTTKSEGEVELAAEDRIRFVVAGDDARVMLGGLSFRSGEEAEAAIAELGYPYYRLSDLLPPPDPRRALSGGARGGEPSKPGRPDAYRFVVRIPEGERASARAKLEAKMVGEADPADHRQGVSVFARPATYLAPAGAVHIERVGPTGPEGGSEVVFPHDENDPAPGYEVKNGKLVERRLPDGMMRVGLDALAEVRLELPIVVNPDGYLLLDGFRPHDVWAWGVGFLGVLAIAMLNALWLVLGVLRRRA